MAEERLLTVRDVSLLLGISEKEVMDLAENGSIPAYKIAGVYLRFKREQVLQFRKISPSHSLKPQVVSGYQLSDRLKDFFYFNDFYILTAILIIILLGIIFWGF